MQILYYLPNVPSQLATPAQYKRALKVHTLKNQKGAKIAWVQ